MPDGDNSMTAVEIEIFISLIICDNNALGRNRGYII
jgi:hypothetical protein